MKEIPASPSSKTWKAIQIRVQSLAKKAQAVQVQPASHRNPL